MPDADFIPYGDNLADVIVRPAGVLLLAAKSGDIAAQFELGIAFKYGKGGIVRDDTLAAQWFAEAAKQGHPGAVYELLSRYARTAGQNRDMAMILRLATHLAEQGDAKVQCELGCAWLAGEGVERNDALAAKWILSSARQGFPRAQLVLSGMYFTGRGVSKNDDEGLRWAISAARTGDEEAQLALGNLYLRGMGVAEDWTQARQWFNRAARQGNKSARHQLLLMDAHEKREAARAREPGAKKAGIGGAFSAAELEQERDARERFEAGMRLLSPAEGRRPDFRLALDLFFRSAELGNEQAMMQLARMHATGTGVRKNTAEAAKWMIQAAEAGNMGAQNEVGLLYEKGDGVRRNVRRAWDWYMQAARQGHAGAHRSLERIHGAPVALEIQGIKP